MSELDCAAWEASGRNGTGGERPRLVWGREWARDMIREFERGAALGMLPPKRKHRRRLRLAG